MGKTFPLTFPCNLKLSPEIEFFSMWVMNRNAGRKIKLSPARVLHNKNENWID